MKTRMTRTMKMMSDFAGRANGSWPALGPRIASYLLTDQVVAPNCFLTGEPQPSAKVWLMIVMCSDQSDIVCFSCCLHHSPCRGAGTQDP